MNISGFSFVWSWSKNILYQAKNINSVFLVYGSNTSYYEWFLDHEKPDIILWIWDYSWVDNKLLRIESYCDNRFRNDLRWANIYSKNSLYIPNSLNKNFKTWKWMWNWRCNNTCYKLSKYIQKEKSLCKLIFVHIPKWYNWILAAKYIDELIKENFILNIKNLDENCTISTI